MHTQYTDTYGYLSYGHFDHGGKDQKLVVTYSICYSQFFLLFPQQFCIAQKRQKMQKLVALYHFSSLNSKLDATLIVSHS